MAKSWNEIAPLPVRIVFGLGFAVHGYPKILTPDGYQNILYIMQQVFPAQLEQFAWVGAYIIGALEFFGGLALLFGIFPRSFGLLFTVEILGNIIMQLIRGGAPHPLNPKQPLPGIESSLMYLAASIAVWIGGAGGWSVTRMFNPKPSD